MITKLTPHQKEMLRLKELARVELSIAHKNFSKADADFRKALKT